MVNAAHPGLIDKFGGHAMAAGLSLPHAQLAAFEQAFVEVVELTLDPLSLQQLLLTDGELLPQELDFAHAEALRLAGPWGQGFPEPLFDGHFQVARWQVLKEKHLKLSLRVPGRAEPISAITHGTNGTIRLNAGGHSRQNSSPIAAATGSAG